MDIPNTKGRAEQIHRAMGLAMHNLRLHHMIVERRIEGVCPGIHHSQHRTLMFLSRAGKAASQKDIAQMMNVSPACVARTLKSLAQAGMIERDEALQDGRCNEVCLSGKGAEVVEESRALFQSLDLEMCAGFTDEEIMQLAGLMEKLNRNLTAMESACTGEK